MENPFKKIRLTWKDMGFLKNPSTKIKKNKKGKGSYKRNKNWRLKNEKDNKRMGIY
jgi:hypothetical protein